MNLGVPKERRPYEYRVGLPPVGVGLFVRHNHTVYVEREAGSAAGFSDEDYARAGAKVLYSEEEVLGRADLVLKFARPLQEELLLMREDQVVAGFLHLAAARQDKFEILRKNKITAIAYEQVVEDDGRRPILAPLSQIGGRMVAQVAARLMQIGSGCQHAATRRASTALAVSPRDHALDRVQLGPRHVLCRRLGGGSSGARWARSHRGHPRDGRGHEAAIGDHRHEYRPRGMRRDLPPHQPWQPHLHRAGGDPLLRAQHVECSWAHSLQRVILWRLSLSGSDCRARRRWGHCTAGGAWERRQHAQAPGKAPSV